MIHLYSKSQHGQTGFSADLPHPSQFMFSPANSQRNPFDARTLWAPAGEPGPNVVLRIKSLNAVRPFALTT